MGKWVIPRFASKANSPPLSHYLSFHTLECMEISRTPNKLKLFRRCSGFSQKKVARILGLADTSTLSRWEHGLAIPGLLQVFRLSRIYNTIPQELFDELWHSIGSEYDLLAQDDEPFSSKQSFYLWVLKLYWCCYATSIWKGHLVSFSFLQPFSESVKKVFAENALYKRTITNEKRTYRFYFDSIKGNYH